jgi:hypothetical protein
MEPTKLPKKPWSKLAIDVCGPFPTGEQVVVLTDYYSCWPELSTSYYFLLLEFSTGYYRYAQHTDFLIKSSPTTHPTLFLLSSRIH